jgi:phosphate starvation-inducible protein PhoH
MSKDYYRNRPFLIAHLSYVPREGVNTCRKGWMKDEANLKIMERVSIVDRLSRTNETADVVLDLINAKALRNRTKLTDDDLFGDYASRYQDQIEQVLKLWAINEVENMPKEQVQESVTRRRTSRELEKVAKNQRNAKRANRPNPREDRNVHYLNTNINLNEDNSRRKKVQLLPRNLAQEDYIDLLEDGASPSCLLPALLARVRRFSLPLCDQAASVRCIKKIILTRPAVSVDEQHGFLPGTLLEKMAPWVIPITDVFKEHYSVAALERMLADEIVEVAPLAYMRGRTLKNAIVIFDEAQNATPSQMKMVLTRLGENSRMIVTGDMAQHDRGFDDNGLKDFLRRKKEDCDEQVCDRSCSGCIVLSRGGCRHVRQGQCERYAQHDAARNQFASCELDIW